MKIFILFMVLVMAHSVTGQDDSWRFRKKNHKLNRNYVHDLNNHATPLFVYNTEAEFRRVDQPKEIIYVYPENVSGRRFFNPDAIIIKYHKQQFNLGNLGIRKLRPVGYGSDPAFTIKRTRIHFFTP